MEDGKIAENGDVCTVTARARGTLNDFPESQRLDARPPSKADVAKENIDMRKTALITAALSILVVGASFKSFAAPIQQPAEAYCSLKTLKGSYIYSIQGYRGGQPYASSGLYSFDGEGQVAIIYTSSIERTQLSTTGTYTVDGDCSGSMTLAAATVVNHFYLSPSGDSFNFVRVSADDVIGAEARRVSRRLIVKQP